MMRMKTSTLLLVFVVFFMLSLKDATVSAQTNTGTIVGTVTDETGAVIPGAKVTTKNLGTGEQRIANADANGEFTVPNLQIGHYSLTVTHEGFAIAEVADIELQVAQRATIN